MLRRHGAELLSLWWLYLVHVGAPAADSCRAGGIGRAGEIGRGPSSKAPPTCEKRGSRGSKVVAFFAAPGRVALTAASLCSGDLAEPPLGSGGTQTHSVAKMSKLDQVQEWPDFQWSVFNEGS